MVVDKQAWVVTGGRDEISLHFHELVPDMALDFPFELDTFQKEVIISIIYIYLFDKKWIFLRINFISISSQGHPY